MNLVVGSTSARKIDMAAKVFAQVFGETAVNAVGCPALSGVSETPYDRETFDGAQNRARHAEELVPNADCYVGLESGLIERYGHTFEEAWCVARIGGEECYGYSSGLKVPTYILEKMDALGKPHYEVMTLIEEEFTKTPSDTWGTYSGGQILREVSLAEAVRNALIQVVKADESLYHY